MPLVLRHWAFWISYRHKRYMEQTDRQTDKSVKTTRWAFTAYESQWHLFKVGCIPASVAEWGWNTEKCPETSRLHYQGYLRTKQQVRLSQLIKIFPGVHLEPARNWEATKNYSGKVETRVPGTEPVSEHSTIPDIYAYTTVIAKRLPSRERLEAIHMEQVVLAQKAVKGKDTPADYEGYHCINVKDTLLWLVDLAVRHDIAEGKFYAAHIAVNPQWVSMWRKYAFELLEGAEKI